MEENAGHKLMSILIYQLKKAITALETSIRCSNNPRLPIEFGAEYAEMLQAAVIQHFEMTFELSWKTLERWMSEKFSDVSIKTMSNKTLFRTAAERNLISCPENWFEYLAAKNKASACIDVVSEDVIKLAPRFSVDVKELFANLEKNNNE